MIRWLAAALAALFLAAAPAGAQTVQQSGTVSNGHVGTWVTSGLIKDGGSPSNFQTNALGLYNGTNSPLGISSQTGAGALSGTWGTLTFGSTSTAASLTTLNSAGTAQPLNLAIGGDATYTIGGTNWLSTIFGQQFCTTTGSVLYRDSGGTWKCLGPGNSGQVLQTQGVGQNPQWAGSGGIGTVTSITAGTGLTGGTITTSGTIALSTPVSVANGGTASTTLTAHNVMLGEGTSAVAFAAPGVSGTCLTSNGVAADPTFQSCPGTGTVTSISAGTGISVSPSPITSSGTISISTVPLANGGTNANLSATGGTSQVLQQTSTGAAITVGQLATSNLSDVVARGTYTPTDASGASLTFSNVSGQYTKIGNWVCAYATLSFPSTANSAAAKISLPVTVANAAYAAVPGASIYLATGGTLVPQAINNQSYFQLFSQDSNIYATNANLSTDTVQYSLCYPAN